MLHPVVRWLARRAIRWFYGEVAFVNRDAIPATGPVLLVGSHGNDLPDILLTFLASDRDILFVANVAAAEFPPVRWTYEGLGVIPISRVRDARALKARGLDATELNAQAFVRVVDALKAGHIVAVFPEGIVPEHPRIGVLRNGGARMALQAIDAGVSPLTMIHVGYQYERAHLMRSNVLAVVGEPINVQDWKPADESRRISEFTGFMAQSLRQVTRNSVTYADADALATLSAVAGAVLARADENPMQHAHDVQHRLSNLASNDGIFVENVANQNAERRSQLEDFSASAREFARLTSAVGANPWAAREHQLALHAVGRDTSSQSPPHENSQSSQALLLIALAPFALLGVLWHAIPWWMCRAIARRFSPRDAEFAAISIVPGLYVVLLWSLLAPVGLLLAGVHPLIVLAMFIAQPALGDAAMKWRDRWRKWRLQARARRMHESERAQLLHAAEDVRRAWRELVT